MEDLAEEVIQHIQSYMSGKEAARSAILSKSWYTAWLSRPNIDLDDDDFYRIRNRFPKRRDVFEEFAKKTMQRYRDSGLNIQSFRLRSHVSGNAFFLCEEEEEESRRDDVSAEAEAAFFSSKVSDENIIADAMKLGATDLRLDLRRKLALPQEVLGSETLLRLYVSECDIDGGEYEIRCSRLKSLSLERVRIPSSERFKDIMISCCDSLEELSLAICDGYGFRLSRANLNELRKLRRLYLQRLNVDSMFFTDLQSRFPCLKDLTIHNCHGCTQTHIATTSLQSMSFKHDGLSLRESDSAEFDVPNIRKFVYSGGGANLPSINTNGASSKECEFDITIACKSLYMTPSWFLNLKRLLTNLRLSRISLCINICDNDRRLSSEYEVEVEVEVEAQPIAVEVENLKIQAQPPLCCALVLRLLGICSPKFITHYHYG